MGDYVHASIKIHGHIPSVAVLDAILLAIEDKGLTDPETEELLDVAGLREAFIRSLVNGHGYAEFSSNEVNYGNLDDVTDVLKEHGIAYSRTYEGSGGENGGEACWYPGEEDEWTDDEAVLDTYKLSLLLNEPDPLAAIRERLVEMKHAEGGDLPELSVSDEVRDHLAVDIAKARIAA
jgi:hypothetical protein